MNKRDVGTKFKYNKKVKLTSQYTPYCGCNGCYFDGIAGHKCFERTRGYDVGQTEVMYCGKGSRQGRYIVYKKA